MRGVLVEICLEDAADAEPVVAAGADRIELCRDLWRGGLTPTDSQILKTLEARPPKGLRILVRERPDGFTLWQQEVSRLAGEIERLRELTSESPVPIGFVVGAITAERLGGVDLPSTRRFKEAAGNAPIVFHRAFDHVANRQEALEQLVNLGYAGILTTGGGPQANITGLKALVRQSAGRIKVIASGGIRDGNAAEIVQLTGASEVHMRAPKKNSTRTDPQMVAAIVRELGAL